MDSSIATLFFFLSLFIDISQISKAETTVPWYESLPAVAMDYKVHIDPGKEDCYFQYVNPGATFYVSFQVLRGGDGMAGFAVRHPSGQIVHPYQWRPNSDYQDQSSTGGYYSVCIDNQFSRFAAKLVNLYLTVIRYDQWDKFTKEVEDLNLSVENFTVVQNIGRNIMVVHQPGQQQKHTHKPSDNRRASFPATKTSILGIQEDTATVSIKTVERNINEMLQYQHYSRGREARDYNLLIDNNSYVQNWSVAQILVITATTVLQVFFVRKLFEIKNVGGRPRA